MKYQDLKQVKIILETYKITDLKQLDLELAKSLKEVTENIEVDIFSLQERIAQAELNLIKITDDMSDEVKEVVNYKNGIFVATDIATLQNELEQQQQLLSEIQNG